MTCSLPRYVNVLPRIRAHLRLKRVIHDQQVQLESAYFCYCTCEPLRVRLEDISLAGIPCVDYSPIGLTQQTRGPTGLLVVVWAHMIQLHRPTFVVIEEVPRTSGSPGPRCLGSFVQLLAQNPSSWA